MLQEMQENARISLKKIKHFNLQILFKICNSTARYVLVRTKTFNMMLFYWMNELSPDLSKEFVNDSLGTSQIHYYLYKFKEIITLFIYLLSFKTATAIFPFQNQCVYSYKEGLEPRFPKKQEVQSSLASQFQGHSGKRLCLW